MTMATRRAVVQPVGDRLKLATALESILGDHGIEVRPGSFLETGILDVFRIDYERRSTFRPDASFDVPSRYANLFGIVELAEQLLAVREHHDFGQLEQHLELLNTTTAPQNRASSQTDQAANRLFELLVACWAMRVGHEVELEVPGARKPNPDVLVTIKGRRWGFACKTLYSTHPESLVENLRKGVQQIRRSAAEIGIVIVNLRNLIPHEMFWRREPGADTPDGAHAWTVFTDRQTPYDLLVGVAREVWDQLAASIGPDVLTSLLNHDRVIPGVSCWAQTSVGVMLEGTPRAAAVRTFSTSVVAAIAPWQKRSLDAMNRAAQSLEAWPPHLAQ